MIDAYKKDTNIRVALGMILQMLPLLLFGSIDATFGLILVIIGYILVILGCCSYAMSKGYSPVWGLLGLLDIIGMLILVFLRDKEMLNGEDK